jgi:Na+-transporting NADH:ubiquinone oxidoreductase subunit NqrE
MEPTGIIAITVSVVLGILAVLCAIAGGVLWCIERTRSLAPFVTFIPTLAMLGAGGGSWGLACLAAMSEPGIYYLPLWAWLIGLPAGGVLGGLLGLWLALLFRSRPTRTLNTARL